MSRHTGESIDNIDRSYVLMEHNTNGHCHEWSTNLNSGIFLNYLHAQNAAEKMRISATITDFEYKM